MPTQSDHLEITDNLTPTLEAVKEDFLNWRCDPHRESRIPEHLWDKLILLLSHHSKSKVLNSLGVSYSQLAEKLKNRQKASVTEVTPLHSPQQNTLGHTFIKAIVTVPTPTTTGFDVVLTKSNGASLQIQKLSHVDLLKLTEQFIG